MRGTAIAVAVSAALGLGVLSPAPALAWNDQGHMATGDIAYDALSARDPKAVAAIVAIMQSHPDRAAFERQLTGLTGKARERRLFALMARWPDDARGSPRDRPEWHYALKVASPWRFVLPITVGDANKAFREQLATARDPRAPRAERAVALCWIMHIVGDQHQPLHAGHWMSWKFPKTDRAGTKAFVRWAPGSASVDLHEFWDGVPNRPGGREAGSEALAAAAEAAHPGRPPAGWGRIRTRPFRAGSAKAGCWPRPWPTRTGPWPPARPGPRLPCCPRAIGPAPATWPTCGWRRRAIGWRTCWRWCGSGRP